MSKPGTPSPDDFMAALSHPLAGEARTLREIILGAGLGLEESLKWNAPSYSLAGVHHFTFNFGDRKSIRLIFHCDTARKETKGGAPMIADETGMLAFQSDIRALAAFRNAGDVAGAKAMLPGLMMQWLKAAQG